jgi:GNAT superfamily N-acetyltransferase
MMNSIERFAPPDLRIRTYQASDLQAAQRLYHEGRLLDRGYRSFAADDTSDLQRIEEVYLNRPQSHFWVAESQGVVIGTIAVIKDSAEIARVRRLRVDPAFRDSAVPARLLQTAVAFCRTHGYLKVVLDTHMEPRQALNILDGDGLLHGRSRRIEGKCILEFYIDLYHRRISDERPIIEEPPALNRVEVPLHQPPPAPMRSGHAASLVQRIDWSNG